LRTLAAVAAAAGPLVFSEDGHSLFVLDTTNSVVNEVDAQCAIWRSHRQLHRRAAANRHT
jgi:hypothetical protein